MTINEALKDSSLKRIEKELILSNILNIPRSYLLAHYDEEISNKSYIKYIDDINKLKDGMPIQYIIGKQEFMGLTFKVNNSVLIPRCDTEILVEEILNYIKQNNLKNPRILDLCTGSGCIAISLAYFLSNKPEIFAIDISDKALEIAKKNAYNILEKSKKLNCIKFIKSNMFENVNYDDKFDIIVSNPPYIETNEIDGLDINVKDYEPKIALDGGKDGLDFYRDILNNAKYFSNTNCLIGLEIGYNQGKALEEMVYNHPEFNNFKIIKDLSKNDRVVLFEVLYNL